MIYNSNLFKFFDKMILFFAILRWCDEVGVHPEDVPSFELESDNNYGHR